MACTPPPASHDRNDAQSIGKMFSTSVSLVAPSEPLTITTSLVHLVRSIIPPCPNHRGYIAQENAKSTKWCEKSEVSEGSLLPGCQGLQISYPRGMEVLGNEC